MISKYFSLASKGFAMGAANVIPGVSGGTIALITGIFEELIHAIKSCNGTAVALLLRGKFSDFAKHINLWFLVAVFGGAVLSIITLARVLDYLFITYPIFIWSFFFGLIIASVVFVGKTIQSRSFSVILSFVVGTAVALTISFLSPGVENDAVWYLMICGVAAVCSMILPGLSGSFVLILLGNYHLIMIDAVNTANIGILLPVILGGVIGLVVFSHGLSWLFKTYKNQTIASLTGFIVGSLALLWPWKKSFDLSFQELSVNKFGAFVSSHGDVLDKVKISTYQQVMPEIDGVFVIALGYMVLGFVSIFIIEKRAKKTKPSA